jgi:hypothetical protein
MTPLIALVTRLCVLGAVALTLHNPWFEAELSGANVVPATESQGSAFVAWYWTEESEVSDVYISYGNLSGTVTGAYVAKGTDSENGPVVRTLASSYFSSPLSMTVEALASDRALLEADSVYVVITTTAYPNGEVRGRFVESHAPATREATWGSVRASFK